jgi:nitrogen regulatory protein PII
MKEIKAYIQRGLYTQVVTELAKIDGLSGVSVCATVGFGRTRSLSDVLR